MSTTKKVVFLDIDGTIITRDGRMPASTKEALERARANGHEMVICTGRSATQLDVVLRQTAFDGIVCAAGAYVTRNGAPVWQDTMDTEHVHKLVDYFRANGMTYFLQSSAGTFTDPTAQAQLEQAFLALGRKWEDLRPMFGGMDVLDAPEDVPDIQKCCYYNCQKPAADVQAELGDYYDIVDSSYKVSRFCDGEINKAGVNKATGMQKYLEAAGVAHADSIAFGDGPNDHEMVEYAAIGVCMGNGTPQLKQIADRVCGPIDEDGLYEEFKALGLL